MGIKFIIIVLLLIFHGDFILCIIYQPLKHCYSKKAELETKLTSHIGIWSDACLDGMPMTSSQELKNSFTFNPSFIFPFNLLILFIFIWFHVLVLVNKIK